MIVTNFDDKITIKVVAGAHNIMMVMNNILMIPDIFIVTTKVVAGAHNIHSILPEDTIQKRKVVDMWKVIEFIL